MQRRYTTILLTSGRLARRDHVVAVVVVISLVLLGLALTVFRPRAAEPVLQPQLVQYVYILSTPSPRPEPTPQPTAEPEVITVYQTVEVPIERPVYIQSAPQGTQPEPAAPPDAQPEPAAPTEELPAPGEDGFKESFVDPPACNPFVGYLPGSPCYRPKP